MEKDYIGISEYINALEITIQSNHIVILWFYYENLILKQTCG